MPSLQFFQQLVESFVPLVDAVLHPGLDHSVSIRNGLKDGLSHYPCPAIWQGFEFQRFERDVPAFGKPFELKRLDQPLRRDLMKHAVKSIFAAVLILLGESPPAAAYRFECFIGRGEASRPKPLGEKLRISMRLEDKLRRGIKLPRDEELLFARLGCDTLSLQILPLLRIEATPKSVKLKFTFVLSLSKDEAMAEHVT
jgi:hypothetical protein